jgi:hypothetical protein
MSKKTSTDRVYLDSYVLQKDNRIRLPKVIEDNFGAVPGETYFDVYFDVKQEEIVLKISSKQAL